MHTLGIVYLAAINLTALFIMAYDKSQARKRGSRVPEKALFFLAAIGGALGALAAMKIWRHKTKHTSFKIGMPMLLGLNVVTTIYLAMNNWL